MPRPNRTSGDATLWGDCGLSRSDIAIQSSRDIDGLAGLGQLSATLWPHTVTYRELVATGSRHSLVVLVFMPNLALKISCGGAVMP